MFVPQTLFKNCSLNIVTMVRLRAFARELVGKTLAVTHARAFPTIFDELSKIVAKAGNDAMAVGIDYMGGSYPLLEGFANMCRAKQSRATFRVNVSSR